MPLVIERSDRDIVEACLRKGDAGRAAFRSLYDRYARDVLRFLHAMLPSGPTTAEDAAQETFLRLHRGLAVFDLERPLRPYLLRIARNVAIEALRRGEREKKLSAEEEVIAATAPCWEEVARTERAAIIRAALAALPQEHRTVIVLRHVHGLKQREVAEALSCTPRTAYNRLRTAAVAFERELRRRGALPGVSEEVSS